MRGTVGIAYRAPVLLCRPTGPASDSVLGPPLAALGPGMRPPTDGAADARNGPMHACR